MTLSIFISNLKCGGCEAYIDRKLRAFSTVRAVEINGETGEVKIETDQPDDRPKFAAELARIGYPEVGENNFFHQARSFASCAMGRLS